LDCEYDPGTFLERDFCSNRHIVCRCGRDIGVYRNKPFVVRSIVRKDNVFIWIIHKCRPIFIVSIIDHKTPVTNVCNMDVWRIRNCLKKTMFKIILSMYMYIQKKQFKCIYAFACLFSSFKERGDILKSKLKSIISYTTNLRIWHRKHSMLIIMFILWNCVCTIANKIISTKTTSMFCISIRLIGNGITILRYVDIVVKFSSVRASECGPRIN